jgi:hypothetical protein
MALNGVGSQNGNVDRLINQLMSRVDTNKDGALSKAEFGTFLTTLLDSLAQPATLPTFPASSVASAPLVARTPAASSTYNPVQGFVLSKLEDPTHVTEKYSAAVRVFSRAIGGLSPKTESLPAIAAFAQANGFPNAKVTGDDTIDFGDGYGSIDVITDVGGPNANWWFNNLPNGVKPSALGS